MSLWLEASWECVCCTLTCLLAKSKMFVCFPPGVRDFGDNVYKGQHTVSASCLWTSLPLGLHRLLWNTNLTELSAEQSSFVWPQLVQARVFYLVYLLWGTLPLSRGLIFFIQRESCRGRWFGCLPSIIRKQNTRCCLCNWLTLMCNFVWWES